MSYISQVHLIRGCEGLSDGWIKGGARWLEDFSSQSAFYWWFLVFVIILYVVARKKSIGKLGNEGWVGKLASLSAKPSKVTDPKCHFLSRQLGLNGRFALNTTQGVFFWTFAPTFLCPIALHSAKKTLATPQTRHSFTEMWSGSGPSPHLSGPQHAVQSLKCSGRHVNASTLLPLSATWTIVRLRLNFDLSSAHYCRAAAWRQCGADRTRNSICAVQPRGRKAPPPMVLVSEMRWHLWFVIPCPHGDDYHSQKQFALWHKVTRALLGCFSSMLGELLCKRNWVQLQVIQLKIVV